MKVTKLLKCLSLIQGILKNYEDDDIEVALDKIHKISNESKNVVVDDNLDTSKTHIKTMKSVLDKLNISDSQARNAYLESLKKDELVSIASLLDLKVNSSFTKKQLINVITNNYSFENLNIRISNRTSFKEKELTK